MHKIRCAEQQSNCLHSFRSNGDFVLRSALPESSIYWPKYLLSFVLDDDFYTLVEVLQKYLKLDLVNIFFIVAWDPFERISIFTLHVPMMKFQTWQKNLISESE
jgi:hypothetical protein